MYYEQFLLNSIGTAITCWQSQQLYLEYVIILCIYSVSHGVSKEKSKS